MSANMREELEQLLLEALSSVTFRLRGFETIAPEAYRELLTLGREEYNADLKRNIALISPEISGNLAAEGVLHFVERELAELLDDRKIQSATFALFGGTAGGHPVEDVAANVLRKAAIDGAASASQAFVDCLDQQSCTFHRFVMVSGVQVEDLFRVSEGITLIPLPEAGSKLPTYLPTVGDLPGSDRFPARQHFFAKTLVRTEYEVSPIFRRPNQADEWQKWPDEIFSVAPKGPMANSFDIHTFCRALGVAGRCDVRPVMFWTSLLEYEIFDLRPYWGIGTTNHTVYLPEVGDQPANTLSRGQLDALDMIYNNLVQPDTEVWRKLRIPIDRLMKSMAESDPVDQMIDLGIALESLYLPSDRQELRYKLALRGAWHQGATNAERSSLFAEFREIYDARSDAVHGGIFRSHRARASFNAEKFVQRAQQLCWNGITAILDSGEVPDWNELVMGELPDGE